MNVKRCINEPTAAAMAYGMMFSEKYKNDSCREIIVFDLGGGTYDVTVLSLENDIVEVRATNGHTHLGGNDIDNMLIDYCK